MAHIKRGSIFVMAAMALLFALALGCKTEGDSTQPSIDTVPPAIPGGVAGSTVNDGVSLSWAANTTDTDLEGYIVYRSTSQNSGYRPITEAPVRSNAFTDGTVQSGQTYYYSVAARDAHRNESARSASYRIIVQDGSRTLQGG